ncbi:MAG: glycosyltransferase family 39 protein [Candidatus Pacebacteria bacterium]|nr:glycosyltransferase family 39 protein [Candidatus Paceibacterota bacterium]
MKILRQSKEWLFLFVVLGIAVGLRLYKITSPLADWHSFRQADTASVTREYIKHGIDLLRPQYHDLSNIQSGKDNPSGYRMVEFPILNAITALLITLFRLQQYEIVVGRLVSISYSIVGLFALYALVRELTGKRAAGIALLTYAVMPYAVYYSRTILPEPAFVTSLLVSLAFLVYATRNKENVFLYGMSILSLTEAFLLKPFAIFFLPLFAYVFFREYRWKALMQWQAYLFFLIPFIPFALWRWWILSFPEGIPASDWLFNKDNIRFTGAFFHWLFEVRIATLMLGIGLVIPAVLGLMKRGKDWLFYTVWAVCILAYMSILAGGNVQHDYYQVVVMPFLCAVVGRGFAFLFELSPRFINKPLLYIGGFGLFIWSLFTSWYQLRGYYNINHPEIVQAGKAVDALVPKDARIIAPYMGDTAFLYQTNRRGWPIGFEIDDKIKKGAQYYVSVNYDDEANALMKKYPVIEKTPMYVLVDLTRTK